MLPDKLLLPIVKRKFNSISFPRNIVTSLTNLLTDIEFSQTTFDKCTNCMVHKGFKKDFDKMAVNVLNYLTIVRETRLTANIICTGYSLGAALATLFSTYLYKNVSLLKGRIQVVVYGSPRVGNIPYANYINSSIVVPNIFMVVYKDDTITDVPTVKQKFYHIGSGVR